MFAHIEEVERLNPPVRSVLQRYCENVKRKGIRISTTRRNLLQTFRAMQAVSEAGYRVLVPPEELARWDYAAQWFDLPYALDGRAAEGVAVPLEIDHERPQVSIGSVRRPLLFPHAVLNELHRSWSERPVLVSFVGHMTKGRRRALRRWRSLSSPRLPMRRARRSETRIVVRDSTKGRSWPEKAWDEDYVHLLGSSQFVLCPDGDFVWTYRFFEAAAAGAIPIVESDCDHYEGFHLATMSDPIDSLQWSQESAIENLERVQELVIAPTRDIRAAVEETVCS